jgi:hypothetical protein
MNPLKLSPLVRLGALIGAGVVFSGFLAWLIFLVRSGWPATLADKQLGALSFIAYGVLALLAIVLVALSAVSVKAQAPGGASLEIDGDGPSNTGQGS